jgi:DNA polymerase III subunit gamma/tau
MATKANSKLDSQPAKVDEAGNKATSTGRYTVVARRYRPKSFSELVGQQTVASALQAAIESDRVGHAYLFTGARGVGKTSTARIFAKALNASKSNSAEVDADLSAAIDSGEDIDVIEIDGASNRGIEEIRQLRANATVRPSRAAYKIYIIDEVHMLTLAAFNALLKTLEEPPEHVKFIFCTTDPEKIPITVLSRCQRFDFTPIKTDDIKARLAEICAAENVVITDDALRLIARRANGSMRDSQSLLEQLLSFAGDEISMQSVHAMLGTADDSRLNELVRTLIDRHAGQALRLLDEAIQTGVDPGQLAEQLLGYLRDMMAMGIGAGEDLLRTANAADSKSIKEMAERWGTMTLLSAIQMLDETLVKMRHSVQSRIILEVCIVQICQLQDLQSIANLAQAIRENAPLPPVIPARFIAVTEPPNEANAPATASSEKKNVEALNVSAAGVVSKDVATIQADSASIEDFDASTTLHNAAHTVEGATEESTPELVAVAHSIVAETNPISDVGIAGDDKPLSKSLSTSIPTNDEALRMWRQSTIDCEGMLSDYAQMAISIEADGATNSWYVVLPLGCDFAIQFLADPSHVQAIAANLRSKFSIERTIRFKTSTSATSNGAAANSTRPAKSINQAQLIRSLSGHPLVSNLMNSLNGEITKIDVPKNYSLSE